MESIREYLEVGSIDRESLIFYTAFADTFHAILAEFRFEPIPTLRLSLQIGAESLQYARSRCRTCVAYERGFSRSRLPSRGSLSTRRTTMMAT